MEKFMKLFQATDMTEGEPWKRIVIFTLPMLIGNIAQQLYSTVDSIVVGKYVGDNALAAVGSATPILNLLLVFRQNYTKYFFICQSKVTLLSHMLFLDDKLLFAHSY